tara:strand:- start:3376 stop:4860 length:1485 start_codon:yes stop_codon:yes gene_type:complete
MQKILYFINQNFSHYLFAKSIQDKINAEIFAIYDVTNKPRQFFENQKIVNFKKIWFFHDFIDEIGKEPDLEFLGNFEKKYDIKLSEIVFSERIFTDFNEFYKFSTNEILRILELECRNFEKILNEVKPDFIFMVTPYFQHQDIFFKLSKALGIKVLEMQMARFSSMTTLGFSDELKNYEKFIPNKNTRTFQELRDFFDKKNIFIQNKSAIKKIEKTDKRNLFSAGLDYFVFSNNDNIKTHYTHYGRNKIQVLKNYLSNEFKIKRRRKFLDDNFNIDIKDGKYVLFPLQTEAEASLSIDAPLFTNQIEIIKLLSKSIPTDYKLLVKEHPAQISRSWRDINTYKEILNIPKVIPIHPEADSKYLLKKSSLVIAISSTVALDALFYEKPSMVFTENTFSMIPSIHKINDINKLSNDINEMLKKKVNPYDIEKYIQFTESVSFNFSMADLGSRINEYFHYSGKFVDVNITEDKMMKFLENEKETLEIVTNEHIEKMNT